METELALPSPPSSLGRRLALVSVRERGVGPEQVRWIATDPEIFEAFYREHVEAIQGFVARRVGDRDRAADLTAEVFLAAIDASPARSSPPTGAKPAGSRPANSDFVPAPCSMKTTRRRSRPGSKPRPSCATSTRRWTASPIRSGRFSSSWRSMN
jgi:hypothetical protein